MLKAVSVTKSYGDKVVLNNVTAEFPAGQVTSLIGPNGAGKSTLLMTLGKLLNADSGGVTLNGQSIESIPANKYACQVATMRQFQQLNLRLTVRDLVAFGRFPYSKGNLTNKDFSAIDEAIELLALKPIANTFIDELSGGQRQMAFLALALAQQTHYLLLDEPLNNLDMKHAVNIMQTLRYLTDEKQKTVILVVHDINFAASYSDRIIAMKQGMVHSAGTVKEVVTEANLEQLFDLKLELVATGKGMLCNFFNVELKDTIHDTENLSQTKK